MAQTVHRGRPTVEQLTGAADTYHTIEAQEPTKTTRTHQNKLYESIGEKFLADHADAIPGTDPLRKGRGCLEQLGRMASKGIETDTIIKHAAAAANAIANGSTVKQATEYLRNGSKHNGKYFNPSFLKSTESQRFAPFSDVDFPYIVAFFESVCRNKLKNEDGEWWMKQEHGRAHILLNSLCREAYTSLLIDMKEELKARARTNPQLLKEYNHIAEEQERNGW